METIYHISPKIKATCFIMCRFPFFCQNSYDASRQRHKTYPVVSGIGKLADDPPWIGLVPEHPTDACQNGICGI